MGSPYTKKYKKKNKSNKSNNSKSNSKTLRKTRRKVYLIGGSNTNESHYTSVPVYNKTYIAKIENTLFKNIVDGLRIDDILDSLGCYGLKNADTYWKSILLNTYTRNTLLELTKNSNSLIKKGLEILQKKNPEEWTTPKTYRDTFLAKHPELLADPSVSGLYIFCLDPIGYTILNTANIGSSNDERLSRNIKTIKSRLAKQILYFAKPGLNLVLSCSQSDVIKVLNMNTEKGPEQGYYYLGFDKNIHYLKNTIFMPTDDTYFDAIRMTEPLPFNTENTSYTYLSKIEALYKHAIQMILDRDTVYFTTESILKKLAMFAACIETAELRRKKEPILTAEIAVFKAKDGKSIQKDDLASFELATKNQKNMGGNELLTNTEFLSIVQTKLDEFQKHDLPYKEAYMKRILETPDLKSYIDEKKYITFEQRLKRLLFLLDSPDYTKEFAYESEYIEFIKSHKEQIDAIPHILEYMDTLTYKSFKDKLDYLQYLLTYAEGSGIVEAWVQRQEEERRRTLYNTVSLNTESNTANISANNSANNSILETNNLNYI